MPEAQAVHGISAADLADKPTFADIADEFIDFIDGAHLVAHNAGFDIAFINAELARLGQPAVDQNRVVDTLAIAKRKHPMGPNSLDALCRRYGIDNSHRTKHGALLDSELLAEVYIELIGGKQAALGLETIATRESDRYEIIASGDRYPPAAGAAGAAPHGRGTGRARGSGRGTRRQGGLAANGPGVVDIQLMPACKWRFSALPVLTYRKVRSVPVLETRHFRLGLS